MAAPILGIGQGIGPLARPNSISVPSQGSTPGSAAAPSFAETLRGALEEVSATQEHAEGAVQEYLGGGPVELHQVMAATEEAGLALEMLVEVRNKLTEAYRSVINMQS